MNSGNLINFVGLGMSLDPFEIRFLLGSSLDLGSHSAFCGSRLIKAVE